jgi:hypothetical protein
MLISGVTILFAVLFYGLHATFLGAVFWALRRRRSVASESGHKSAFWLTALGMVLLPIANAVWIVAAVAHAEPVALPLFALFFVAGGTLFVAGLTASGSRPLRLTLRIYGWSLIAGVAIIPSILVVLLPVPIILAFFVPEDYRRGQSVQAVA